MYYRLYTHYIDQMPQGESIYYDDDDDDDDGCFTATFVHMVG